MKASISYEIQVYDKGLRKYVRHVGLSTRSGTSALSSTDWCRSNRPGQKFRLVKVTKEVVG